MLMLRLYKEITIYLLLLVNKSTTTYPTLAILNNYLR